MGLQDQLDCWQNTQKALSEHYDIFLCFWQMTVIAHLKCNKDYKGIVRVEKIDTTHMSAHYIWYMIWSCRYLSLAWRNLKLGSAQS